MAQSMHTQSLYCQPVLIKSYMYSAFSTHSSTDALEAEHSENKTQSCYQDSVANPDYFSIYFSLLQDLQSIVANLEITSAERQLSPSEYMIFRSVQAQIDDILAFEAHAPTSRH